MAVGDVSVIELFLDEAVSSRLPTYRILVMDEILGDSECLTPPPPLTNTRHWHLSKKKCRSKVSPSTSGGCLKNARQQKSPFSAITLLSRWPLTSQTGTRRLYEPSGFYWAGKKVALPSPTSQTGTSNVYVFIPPLRYRIPQSQRLVGGGKKTPPTSQKGGAIVADVTSGNHRRACVYSIASTGWNPMPASPSDEFLCTSSLIIRHRKKKGKTSIQNFSTVITILYVAWIQPVVPEMYYNTMYIGTTRKLLFLYRIAGRIKQSDGKLSFLSVSEDKRESFFQPSAVLSFVVNNVLPSRLLFLFTI